MQIRTRQSGFTLVEILVTIAIIGLLVAILLPALNSAREQARMVHCVNNLKQIGIAISNYESANSRFPAAGIFGEPKENPTTVEGSCPVREGPQLSWMVLILPFMEENNVYDRFDLEAHVTEQGPGSADVLISSYMCPADQDSSRDYRRGDATLAKGNYAAFASPYFSDMEEHWPGALGGFVPGEKVGQSSRQIKDGLSKTMAVTEVRARAEERDGRGVWAAAWPGSSLVSPHIKPDQATGGTIASIKERDGGLYFTVDLNHQGYRLPNSEKADGIDVCVRPVQARAEKMPCRRADHQCFYYSAPRSLHASGGVNSVALDGHVGFVSENVDLLPYAYAISASDAKVASITEVMR